MCSMMFKQSKNFENKILWNAQHNLREKGLKCGITVNLQEFYQVSYQDIFKHDINFFTERRKSGV